MKGFEVFKTLGQFFLTLLALNILYLLWPFLRNFTQALLRIFVL